MAKPSRKNRSNSAPAAPVAPAVRPVTTSAPATPASTSRPALGNPAAAPVAANKPSARIESKPAGEPSFVTQSAIAEAAYFLWLQRGGNETVNWLEAERMLKSKAAAATR